MVKFQAFLQLFPLRPLLDQGVIAATFLWPGHFLIWNPRSFDHLVTATNDTYWSPEMFVFLINLPLEMSDGLKRLLNGYLTQTFKFGYSDQTIAQ